MFDQIELGREFFERLMAVDEEILERAAAQACRFCDGPLHRGDFFRKPRGGLLAAAGEVFTRRFSLCCGREGCRRRAMPPSVRFLGRRVYLGAAVILASMIALCLAAARDCQRATEIPFRTVRRWSQWWRGPFITTAVFVDLSSQLVPAISHEALPTSLIMRFTGEPSTRIGGLLGWLAPLTTASSPNGSRCVRGLMAAATKPPFTQKMA
jgi:hypothetical protein